MVKPWDMAHRVIKHLNFGDLHFTAHCAHWAAALRTALVINIYFSTTLLHHGPRALSPPSLRRRSPYAWGQSATQCHGEGDQYSHGG